ncbi:GIY-YIG nuclease family protein [Streptomyces sp. TRM66268-LWL]|uniref:GIY-YIG nuclease family protein n=1 Tax=Streptomyces polyasparticus TaxID=2767826 RepID=A0ABR7STC6_9ACTN|nr:GIY-YIG nuclease family protein [Streptomyces polyasparticus]MBC9718029.1 GIY-YIG nuclease family protein [Streptomyces polyasparticus]
MTITEASEAVSAEYYVYIYRDPETREVRYIGKGVRNRVEKHLDESHNPELAAWIERLRKRRVAPLVEHFPCASEKEAYAVEGALISTFWSDPAARNGSGIFNGVHGRGHFAPLGLPSTLAKSAYKPPLTRDDIAELGGALMVLISTTDFENEFDQRPGAMPRLHLPDAVVYERIVGWWQIHQHVKAWQDGQGAPPQLIIGVTGPMSRRWVWGSVRVPRSAWAKAEHESGGLCRVPASTKTINAAHLRGRLLTSDDFGPLQASGVRRFGSVRAHQFDIVEPAPPADAP